MPQRDSFDQRTDSSSWLDRLAHRLGNWPTLLLLTLTMQSLSYLLNPFPLSDSLGRYVRYHTVVVLCDDPLTTAPLQEPTVRHRVLVPLLAWVLHLRGSAYLVLLFVGTYLFLLGSLILLRRYLPWTQSALTTLLVSTTLAATTTTQWLTVQDSWANAAVVACLLLGRVPWCMGACFLVGMLADERCITTVPLLLLWFYLEESPAEWRGRLMPRLISVAVCVVLYASVYFALHRLNAPSEHLKYYGFRDNAGFVDSILKGEVFLKQIMYVPAGFWFALRAGWLPILLLWWTRRRESWFRTWLLGGLVCATGHALLVEDLSRVMSLAFPALLLAVVQLYQRWPRWTSQLLCLCLLVNLLSPQYQINHDRSTLIVPLPFQALRQLQTERSGISP